MSRRKHAHYLTDIVTKIDVHVVKIAKGSRVYFKKVQVSY